MTDVADVLQRARNAGVERVLTAAEDVASSEAAVALAREHRELRVAVGVHPHHAADWDEASADGLAELARDARVVAIGEIGMDLSGRSAGESDQERALRAQLALAARFGLPVVLHVRDAGDLVRRILDESAPVRGMVHCYSEGPDEVPLWIERGLHLSFAGTVTYPSAGRLRDAAALVPADRLLAETDAPYLAPQNVRGRRNEPRYVAATYAALAGVRRSDLGDLVAAVAANAKGLFGDRWGT